MMKESPTDPGLLDMHGIQLDKLLSEPDESAFKRALDRILATSGNACIGGFQATI
jgi:hypothetical protein